MRWLAVHRRLDDEAAGVQLFAVAQLPGILHDATDAAMAGEAVEQVPFAAHRRGSREAVAHRAGVLLMPTPCLHIALVHCEVVEAQELQSRRPALPIPVAIVDEAVLGFPQRAGTTLLPWAIRPERDALAADEDAHYRPGRAGERESLRLGDVHPLRTTAHEGGGGTDETGDASDVAGLAHRELQGGFVNPAVDGGPADPGAGGEVIAGHVGKGPL